MSVDLLPGIEVCPRLVEVPAHELEQAYRRSALTAIVNSDYGAKPCRVRGVSLTGVGTHLVFSGAVCGALGITEGCIYRTVPRSEATFVRPNPDWFAMREEQREWGAYAGIPVVMDGEERVIIGPKIRVFAWPDQSALDRHRERFGRPSEAEGRLLKLRERLKAFGPTSSARDWVRFPRVIR